MRLKQSSEQAVAKFAVNRVSVLFVLAAFAGLVTGWTAIGVGEVVALYLLFFYRLRLDIAIGTGVAVWRLVQSPVLYFTPILVVLHGTC